jgi:FHS family Na+ dependent glucose MFS transporter 1
MDTTQKSARPVIAGKATKTIAYYASFVALGLTSASMGPTLPALAAHTHTHLNEVSFLFIARSLGYLLGSLRGGRWYDRFPGHRVQASALLLMAGMMAMVPTLPKLWLLAGVLAILGFGEGTLDVGGNALLVWIHRDKVGPFMNALHFFFGIGSFLSPIVVAQAILLSQDVSWAYWVLAIMLLPVAFGLARQPSPVIPADTHQEHGGKVAAWTVILFMLFFFFNVGAESSFGGWIFTYAQAQGLGNQATAAYLTSAFWGALTLGRLLTIPIAARVHPRWILLGNLLGCLVSVGLILIWKGSYVGVWLGALGTGLFMASIFPVTMTLAERYLPINGRFTGYFLVGGSAGSMFFPWLIGQLFEPVGPQSSMVLILTALAAALAIWVGLVLGVRRLAKVRE